MGIYSPEVVEILKQSPYIENVSEHVIQYGDAFKQECYCLSQQGHKPKDIFLSLGLDPALLGSNVIRSFVRSMKDFQPKLNQAGQPISITRSLIEKDEEIEKLKFEVKFLKKRGSSTWECFRKRSQTTLL